MNILEVTEDKIFKVLGKGRDPKFKPLEKARAIPFIPFKSNVKNREKQHGKLFLFHTYPNIMLLSHPIS